MDSNPIHIFNDELQETTTEFPVIKNKLPKVCLRCKEELPYQAFIYDDDDTFCSDCQDYFFELVK